MARKRKSSKPAVKRRGNKAQRTPTPETPNEGASREAVRDILNRLFDGSAEELVESLAASNQLTPRESARMKEVFGGPKRNKKRRN